MANIGPAQKKVLTVLSDGKPRSHREIVKKGGLSYKSVGHALRRLWEKELIFRTEEPIRERNSIFKGRAGKTSNLRSYRLYVLCQKRVDSLHIQGVRFVKYDKKYLDKRAFGKSKAKMVLEFLKKNQDRAFFSTEVAEALKDKGVKLSDIMANMRRFEKKGRVYIRGYRTHENETPFKEGYLLTWIDPNKSRDEALDEAIRRTNKALADRSSTSPVIGRIRLIRDQIIEASKLKDLVGFDYILNKLGCSEHEAKRALKRTMQLYSDIKEIKLFNAYRYFCHTSLSEEDLKAAIATMENYIRKVKGRANRIGHNWEACVEWFIDTYTVGANFRTQNHRTKRMDPRRVTIHLIKSVGRRRQNAELDRVWSITPSIFAKPITYILECKWGLVRRESVDDFLNVLRWSKEFGVDTPEGRQVKQGVIGVFAGRAFNPKENVRLKNDTVISLASYAARMNIQLLKATDFNEKLRGRGCPKTVTVQKVCRIAKDEDGVRELLDKIWADTKKSEEVLSKAMEKNKEVYDFEKMLESSGK